MKGAGPSCALFAVCNESLRFFLAPLVECNGGMWYLLLMEAVHLLSMRKEKTMKKNKISVRVRTKALLMALLSVAVM